MTLVDVVAYQAGRFRTKPRIVGIELHNRWDPAAFRNKLSALGFGLLLVEGDAVSESLAPRNERPIFPA
ncbi:MAG TPA: hypothetical protein VNO55_25215 [Polyangia bacterium]|nr:hypothetical protein [Polyangia bacterium]